MPYWLVHANTSIQKVSTDGTPTTLSLPSGASIVATRRGRFAVLGQVVVFVNAGNKNLAIDAALTVRVMSIPKPASAATAAIGSSGALTGNYSWAYTYAELSGSTVVSESPLSDASNTVSLTADRADLTGVTVAPAGNGATHRRIYRTAAGGSEYFLAGSIADNTTTIYTDNVTDESLPTAAASTDLGNPPGTTTAERLDVITAWKDRLWASSTAAAFVDSVYYSGINRVFAWASTQALPVKPAGQDIEGITAFLPRRDELGIGKRRGLWKVIGDIPAKFQIIQVANGVGVFAPESVVIIRDKAYFLAEDGVYSWGADGVIKLSTERVDPWFTRDDTFNSALKSSAFAKWNQREDTYELHLAAAGSSVVDRWVSYDLRTQRWLGPSKTDAFTPSAAGMLENEAALSMAVQGSTAGYLYRQNDPSYVDGASTAIDADWDTAFDAAKLPALRKVFGELVVLTKAELSGTLTITPYAGELTASAGTAQSHALTRERSRLARVGVGRAMRLNFRQATANVGCQVHGYEVPVVIVGNR